MDVEGKLQQLYQLQPLQNEALVLRVECMKKYKKDVKLSCVQEMQNLVNVEIDLIQTEIKFPEPNKIPPIRQYPLAHGRLEDILQYQKRTIEALRMMDML